MKKIYTLIICLCVLNNIKAQQNIVKLNVAGLLLTNVSLQYERSLNEKSSVALGLSFLPERSLPGTISKKDDSGHAQDFKLGGFALTPEYRYYFKGNGPKGLYL